MSFQILEQKRRILELEHAIAGKNNELEDAKEEVSFYQSVEILVFTGDFCKRVEILVFIRDFVFEREAFVRNVSGVVLQLQPICFAKFCIG